MKTAFICIVFKLLLFPTIGLAEKTQITGTVLLGPEAMLFIECGSNKQWWLNDNSFKARGWETVSKELDSQPLCDLSTMPCKHQAAVINGVASLSKKGHYGHLGIYERQITFIEASLVTKGSCN